MHSTRRLFLLTSILGVLLLGTVTFAGTGSNTITSGASTLSSAEQPFWADSIAAVSGTRAEHDLQYYLDSLGYNINVANDELGLETFCAMDGINTATMVIEVAGSAVYATSGYYNAGDTSIFYQLFGPSDGPGDSVQFSFSSINYVGFYMKPNLPNKNETWLTENNLNRDNYDHAWVFSTGLPHEYLICFEDLPDGGDEDYQDLVIRVTFTNSPPVFTFPNDGEIFVTLCSPEEICFNIQVTDANCEGDSIWVDMLSGEGMFNPTGGVTTINTTHCFTPSVNGTYEFVFEAEDNLGAVTIDTVIVDVTTGTVPVVNLNDTSFTLCEATEICLPIEVIDPDCDVISITTNFGTYTGTMSDFDQIQRLNQLGGTVIQIGGGAPGTILTTASDFVAPVNSQSGVDVTLPNFVFADHVVYYGSFPNGTEPGNSADHLLYSPTDLTFTSPGPGGPDGGNGDGSVAFTSGKRCVLGFPQDVTSCHGANADFVIFTNTAGSGTARLKFRLNGTTVLVQTLNVPSGTASSGMGGITLDLPDGITFNEIRIKCTSGSFEIDALAARTSPSSTTADVCFIADTSGVYELIVQAEDSCGSIGADTAYIIIDMNDAPMADAGDDISVFACNFEEVCFGVSFSDPDDNLASTSLISGPGTLNGNQICFTPTIIGANTFVIRATDECGLIDQDTVVVTIYVNDPPVADEPASVSVFQCAATELCHDFTASDPNGGPLTWTHLAGVGSIISSGHFCFTPSASGSYNAAVVVTDSCGAADTVSINYTISLNSTPVLANPGAAIDIFQCTADEICYQFTATDADNDALTFSLLSGPGTLSGTGNYCFTPAANGSYSATVVVTDSCGTADTATVSHDVTLNAPPILTLDADTALELCAPQQVCVNYAVSDPQGLAGLTESMISGYGTADTANNQICFTPTTDGNYQFIMSITDDCGETDLDTVQVIVVFGTFAQITCPPDPIDVFLCASGQVCQAITITPATASISTSFGIFSAGELCFAADTSGVYNITIIAEETCSSDTCQLIFNVEIGQAAQIDCPAPSTLFICESETVCIPVGIYGSGVSVTVTPTGTYASGNLCFEADTSGHYAITVIASTSCGVDTCLVEANITINSAPVATDPSTPIDTFLCAPQQVCYQFAGTDVNNNLVGWTRLSGDGSINESGLWCVDFTANSTKQVTAILTDSCGAADTTTLTINATINSAPVVTLPADETRFLCNLGPVCVFYDTSDVDDNIVLLEELTGLGTINDVVGQVCFDPTGEGIYQLILKTTDACGTAAIDTINITIDLNEAPTLFAGDDLTVFQCNLSEICWSVTSGDPDGNLSTVEKIDGPGTFDGSQICFTPTGTYNYEFVLKATDICGLETWDTVAVFYTLNTPPVADAGADQTLFQCTPTEVCWPVSCSDIDGNLSSCALMSGPGTYDGSQICFTPGTSGSYVFVMQALDVCGASNLDSVTIDITINSAPVCTIPNDTLIFMCQSAEVCLPAFATDVDGNLDFCQIISGPGTINGSNWCYTPVSDQAVTITLLCQDDCGATCESQFTVEFDINDAPTVTLGSDTAIFLCNPQQICLPYIANDPDNGRPVTLTLTGPGTLDEANSQICFDASVEGTYDFTLSMEDECGVIISDDIAVIISFNEAPIASAGDDQTLFLCNSSEICWQASCDDPDNNLTNCIFNGPGTYDGYEICFVPPISGLYIFTMTAIDDCGLTVVDTARMTITINSSPILTMDADTSLFLCDPQQICLGYQVSDADGTDGLIENMVAGYGTLDTSVNQVCFTPTTADTYQFIMRVTDDCGAIGEDTINVVVTFGESPVVSCPAPEDFFLCDVDSIIIPITVSPVSAAVIVSEGIYADGAVRFLASAAGAYSITVTATTACGSDNCVLSGDIAFNQAPVADAGSDQTLELCESTQICWSASCSDPDGNLTACELVNGVGTYNGSQICFTPTATSVTEFILKATDACGVVAYDTVSVDVTLNSVPDVITQADTSQFLCAPQEICLSYTPSDPDGLTGLVESMVSGYGSIDTANNRMCFTPTTAGIYEFVVGVSDPCNESALDTVVATITFGDDPVVTCPAPEDFFLCGADSIIIPVAVNPIGATVTVTSGIFADGAVRFYADTEDAYNITVTATTACGSDDCVVSGNISFNEAPVANAGTDQTLDLCESTEICWSASCSDPDDNLTACELVSGVGTYNGSQICFTPTATSNTEFILKATDNCGEVDYDTVYIDVTLNSAPTVVTQADTSQFLCAPQEICLSYTPSDPDGLAGLAESMLSGYGSIDTANNQLCFTPTTAGIYQFIVSVTDPCNESDLDTIVATITWGEFAQIDCPTEAIDMFLCAADDICQMIDISPAGATVTVSHGTYSAGELCFYADTSGTYIIDIIASASCGDDTCQVTFNVEIGSQVQIDCPAPSSRFLCEAGDICIPVGVQGTGITVTVSPIGSYASGSICFPADTTGSYEIQLIATTSCGTDTCLVEMDVTLNTAPVAVDPTSPTDTFLCDPAQICYQFGGSDADGHALTYSMTGGDGSVSSSGLWCVDVAGSGSKTVNVAVSDSCGAADTTSLTYNFTMNSAPVVAIGNDTSLFICPGEQICLDYVTSDADDNIISETLVSGPGTIDTNSDVVCFSPTSSGNYEFIIMATDACGYDDLDTIEVSVTIGATVSLTCPANVTLFLCEATQSCFPITVTPASAIVTISPYGTYDGSQICIDLDTTGHYVFTVEAATSCDTASCSFTIDVTLNSAPVATIPTSPVDTFLCDPAQICYQFGATDPDGNALTYSKINGDGTISSTGLWCFDATTSGSKTVSVAVADSCDAADTIGLTYNITINSTPVVVLGNDTSLFICPGQQVCVDYTTSDADDNIVNESLVSGPGTIDIGSDVVCFSPTSSGNYEFVVMVTDACGANDLDTMQVTVTIGATVDLTCVDDTALFLCGPTQVCFPASVSPSSANVSVLPFGTYSSGQVCVDLDTAGHYVFTIEATTDCDTASCSFVVDVTMNSIPWADDPGVAVDTFIYEPGEICCPFTAHDDDNETLSWQRISGNGTVSSDGQWCFTPTATDIYTVCASVSDGCGAADTVCHTYNVTLNGPPTITFDRNRTVFKCPGESECLTYTTTDPDDNIVSEIMTIGQGVLDTVLNQICFTPDTNGTYVFAMQATDEGGLFDADTISVTIELNEPPVVNLGSDRTVFMCTASEICWPATVSDPNDNIDSILILSELGTFASGQFCFVPDTAGIYTLIMRVVDECSEVDVDTVLVEVSLNSAPTCQAPDDTTFFQCNPTQVSLPIDASDVDGNFDHCEIVTGSGSIVGGQWIYTPTTNEQFTVSVMCLDECGAMCETSFEVTFEINNAPVVDAGDDIVFFACGMGESLCWPITSSDEDGNLSTIELTSEYGNYASSQICFTIPDGERTYLFILKATDICGAESFDTCLVSVEYNAPPILSLPPDFIAYLDAPGQACFTVGASDEDDNLESVMVSSAYGQYSSTTGQVCFQADTSGHYCFELTAVDDCLDSDVDSVCVDIIIDECIHVQIQKTHDAIQGQVDSVSIFMNGSGKELGAFDILIAYDASALSVNAVRPGALLTDCGWEYFNFRQGDNGNCGSACPTGLLRIVGMAETNNGAYHPGCYLDGLIGSLVDVFFLVSNDRTLECQYVPIEFLWMDCGDNAFSSKLGDTLWISRHVYNFEHNPITNNTFGFPGKYGAHDSCMTAGGEGKPAALRCVDFTNGGIDIICADSIDGRGDINLNEVMYEIADAVIYSNYFVHGLDVFTINIDGQIAASDVNADGLTLTVADLVYLIRVILGDVPAVPKLAPGEIIQAEFEVRGGLLSIASTEYRIGAVNLLLEGEVEPILPDEISHMHLRYHFDGVDTRVLIYSMNPGAYVEAGALLKIGEETAVKEIGAGSYDGFVIASKTNLIPDKFELTQNFPNPFNPSTTFEFALSEPSDWELVVYNVLGQTVTSWSGHSNAGWVNIIWNATDYSSGVYFYRLQANDNVDTKKMVLLK